MPGGRTLRSVPTTADVRTRLLDAAMELLATRGPAALRVRDVAAAAGMSTMGVYTHFGSKQRLLDEIYGDGLGALDRHLGLVPASGNPRADLLAFARAYRTFAIEHENLYALMFERAAPDFIPSPETRRAGLGAFERLASHVAAWRDDAAGAAQDAHLLWSAMHGLVSIELTHRRWGGPVMEHLQGDPDETFEGAIEALLDALYARAR
jgi:AcrR family transcriptional regulator